jgi:hypothetical protein
MRCCSSHPLLNGYARGFGQLSDLRNAQHRKVTFTGPNHHLHIWHAQTASGAERRMALKFGYIAASGRTRNAQCLGKRHRFTYASVDSHESPLSVICCPKTIIGCPLQNGN